MPDTSNLFNKKNVEQILNDIQSLQDTEQKLFNSLESNTLLTSDQQKKIINQINQLSEMRLNLYKTLGGVNKFYQNILSQAQNVSNQQRQAIQIVEQQLNESKKKLKYLESEKNNKTRLIQINDYYGEKYNEHTKLMKYIIFMLIPIIILCFIYNLGILPSFLFYILIVIISVVGSTYIIYKMVSIWSRDNMNYQEFDWSFNGKKAPSVKDSAGNSDSPWFSSNINLGTCIGDACCSPGTLYDNNMNQCILNQN